MLDSKWIPLFLGGFVAWMLFVIGSGWFGSRGKRQGEKFLTGGSDMNLFLIFCTLGATIIGTGSSIGAVGDGFSHGWGGAIFGLGSGLGLLILTAFASVRKKNFITMSEEAQYYYGGERRVRQLMGFMMFVIEIIWIGNHVNGGSKYLSYVLGLDPTWCKLITAAGFGAYVFAGGYVAVVKADVIQFLAIVLGFGIIAVRAVPMAGGYDEISRVFAATGKSGAMGFYGLGSYGVMAGVSLVLAMTLNVVGCPGNRTRIYTAKTPRTARRAFLCQGAMMFLWSLLVAVIGMSAYAIMVHNGHHLATGDYAFPYLATQVMEPALGLFFMICGLSAAVSSGGSSSISGITILLTDVYPSLTGRRIPQEKYNLVSRLALLLALAIAFSITIFVSDMIAYIQKVVGAFLPGVAVTMLLGRFWKRATWVGALSAVFAGTALGVLIVAVPPLADAIKATFGGPAIPATAVALAAFVLGSLLSKRDETPEAERLEAVFAARVGERVKGLKSYEEV